MRQNIKISVLFILLMTAPGMASATAPEAASKFIGDLSARSASALNKPGSTLDQKEADVRKLLSENFDLKLIGRFVLGSTWRKTSLEQRDQYLELFEQFVLRTYSRRLGGYSGQQFNVVGAKPIGKQDVLVSTLIARPSGPPIAAGWRVREGKS
ncbi:MAG: ABC transporter substrate-binding protein, partial [Rhodospirillales bacterium]|nr:ABC transporter substrate-binding protein [Rhodospirillales bacterium]